MMPGRELNESEDTERGVDGLGFCPALEMLEDVVDFSHGDGVRCEVGEEGVVSEICLEGCFELRL